MNTLPSETLRNLIVRYGRSLCDDPRRLEALLRDYCGTYRQEISVLTGAARERIPPDLLTSVSTMPIEIAIAQQTKRLQANLGLSEDSARWSVQSWAFALGLLSETEISAPPPPPPLPDPPQKPPSVPPQYQRETITPPAPQPPMFPPQPPQPIIPPPTPTPAIEYASFWERVLASIMDTIILGLSGGIIGGLFGVMYVAVVGSSYSSSELETLANWIGLVLNWLYFVWQESSEKQATIGKRIMGIQVTDLNGQKLSFGQANARYFSKVISLITLGIGFLMPLFDSKKQALHDRISNCLLVKR